MALSGAVLPLRAEPCLGLLNPPAAPYPGRTPGAGEGPRGSSAPLPSPSAPHPQADRWTRQEGAAGPGHLSPPSQLGPQGLPRAGCTEESAGRQAAVGAGGQAFLGQPPSPLSKQRPYLQGKSCWFEVICLSPSLHATPSTWTGRTQERDRPLLPPPLLP